MVISKILDDRKEEMLALAQKTLNNEVLLEEDGAEEYAIHLDEGVIEVDGKRVETSVMEFFDSDDYHEWNEKQLKRYEKLDWFIVWAITEAGEFKTDSGKLEGRFLSTELHLQNNLLHYRNLPLVVPSNGTNVFSNELEIYFGDQTRESLEMTKVDN